MNWKALITSKTFWTAITGMAVAIATYSTGHLDLQSLIQAIFGGLTAIFVRDAIANGNS